MSAAERTRVRFDGFFGSGFRGVRGGEGGGGGEGTAKRYLY